MDQIVSWFTQIVDEAIELGGGSGDDSDETAAAIWYVLIGDWHRDPQRVRPPRCPAVAEIPGPGEEGFLAALRAGAAGYMHTAIAGASEDEISALCWLVVAVDGELEAYRPLGGAYTEESPASELITSALSDLIRRRPTNAALCRGLEGWAQGFAAMVTEHAIPPVDRIGAIAWLARVAFRDEECAGVKPRKEKVRTTHERDLMELLANAQQNDTRVADALVTVLRADRSTLAAIGVVIDFVAGTQATRRPR